MNFFFIFGSLDTVFDKTKSADGAIKKWVKKTYFGVRQRRIKPNRIVNQRNKDKIISFVNTTVE